jgi:hypothetical protein
VTAVGGVEGGWAGEQDDASIKTNMLKTTNDKQFFMAVSFNLHVMMIFARKNLDYPPR